MTVYDLAFLLESTNLRAVIDAHLKGRAERKKTDEGPDLSVSRAIVIRFTTIHVVPLHV
jgi:hypothetical protein